MRKWKKYKGRALAVVLAAALAGGAVTVPGVLAEKTEESSDSDDPGEDADQADDANEENADGNQDSGNTDSGNTDSGEDGENGAGTNDTGSGENGADTDSAGSGSNNADTDSTGNGANGAGTSDTGNVDKDTDHTGSGDTDKDTADTGSEENNKGTGSAGSTDISKDADTTGNAADSKDTGKDTEKDTAQAEENKDSTKETKDTIETKETIENANSGNNGGKGGKTANSGVKEATKEAEKETAEPLRYDLQIIVDGTELEEGEKEQVLQWEEGTSKLIEISGERRGGSEEETDQEAVLSITLGNLFYFKELPDIEEMTGIQDMVFVPDDTLQEEDIQGMTENMEETGKNSGELQLLLDPLADIVDLAPLELCYRPELVGYIGGNQEIEDPLRISLLIGDGLTVMSADGSSDPTADVKKTEEADAAEGAFKEYSISSVSLETGSQEEKSLKSSMIIEKAEEDAKESTKENAAQADTKDTVLKKEDSFYYTCGLGDQDAQVYRQLTAAFSCPYITIDGVKHYLDFSTEDKALTENRHEEKQAFALKEPVVYEEEEHRFIYSFENVCLGKEDILFYTPVFTLPKEILENRTVQQTENYEIQGGNWEILEQTGYTGLEATLQTTYEQGQAVSFALEGDQDQKPFAMEALFDGKPLSDTEKNIFTADWAATEARTLNVTVNRQNNTLVEADKQYVLSMKLSELFYFNGIPKASDITGVEKVEFIQNTAPQVNTSGGSTSALPGFSPYSGELRLYLNTSVETIEVKDIVIRYSNELAGYTGGTQVAEDILQISLIKAENGENLDGEQNTVIESCKVDAVSLRTGSLAGSGLRNFMSVDGFQTSGITEQDVYLGKGDTISYTGGTAGPSYQVYKKMVVKFHCPYIEIGENKEKHYLGFSADDTALKENKQGNESGYKLTETQSDLINHTITYTFENIYIGSFTKLFYTPCFSWPSELADMEVQGEPMKILGAEWEITEQTTYTGQVSTLKNTFTPTRFAWYVQTAPDIKMTSSAQAAEGEKIAKRRIYQGLTKENGIVGALGFFDIHNDGAQDSPELKITFQFNTGDGDAEYYVTQVNIPVYGNTGGTDVDYELDDGTTGKKHYPNQSSFNIKVSNLTGNSDRYIKKISYQAKLKKSTAYHLETAHLYRNRYNDQGLFFGYIKGELGSQAHATMTIESLDAARSLSSSSSITKISSVETSTVSDEDFIAFGLSAMNTNGQTTRQISAGDSVSVTFGATVNSEEHDYNGGGYVNGYHVFRDGKFYICLPDKVSIPGKEQAFVNIYNSGTLKSKVQAASVKRLDASCTVNGTTAYWWCIEVKGINAQNNGSQDMAEAVRATVQLATDASMQSINWDFRNCVAVQADGQAISWGAAMSIGVNCNTLAALRKSSSTQIQSLASYFETQGKTDNLGMGVYNSSDGVVKLNIVRAEAKLEVETSLHKENETDNVSSITLGSADDRLEYDVTISSNDGGAASDFSYYIPIVSTDSKLDPQALAVEKEFNLKLLNAVEVKKIRQGTTNTDIPFQVYYTKAGNLDSETIRGDAVTWYTDDQLSDYSGITAVKIVTTENAQVDTGDAYRFRIAVGYDNAANDFAANAGKRDSWRSFGRYTYVRNGSTTTNSYPNEGVSVIVSYTEDKTTDQSARIHVVLDTAAAANRVEKKQDLSWTPLKSQVLKIKKAVVSSGTSLVTADPSGFTGADANSKFRLYFNVNNGTEAVITTDKECSQSWTVPAGQAVEMEIKAEFSKALTDVTTARYVDVTIGNDYVTIVRRIQLDRNVKPASADGSGTAVGSHYQVTNVTDAGTASVISQNSSFTALYVVHDFVPGNFDSRFITWKKGGETDPFPKGTAITMLEISSDNQVTDFWYYKSDGTAAKVDLKEFTRMSGNEKYSYVTTGTSAVSFRYQFIVDFSGAEETDTGDYQLALGVADSKNVNTFADVDLPVELKARTTYSLSAAGTQEGPADHPSVVFTYAVNGSEGDDSFSEHRSLALVLTAKDPAELPGDASLNIEEGETRDSFNQIKKGVFVIPLGTIQSGNKTIIMRSDLFPEEEKDYSFTAQLYLSDSSESASPLNGRKAGSSVDVVFKKADAKRPALKISGMRVADLADWAEGCPVNIQVQNIPEQGTMTVTPYYGLAGSDKATALLSSVSGVFTIGNGTGTYDSSKTPTGQLILSSSAQKGTYRLLFEIKDASQTTVLTVPYYVIVR